MSVSARHGQLTGAGLEGCYRSGRRILSRCRLLIGGREPVPVQAAVTAADQAVFVATLRTGAEAGPDPDLVVERTRHAEGVERIVLRSSAGRPMRLPVEIVLGADLAELGAVAAGTPGRELPASVHDSGLRWTSGTRHSTVTADPAPHTVLAATGLLRWDLDLAPGAVRSIELRVRAGDTGEGREGRSAVAGRPAAAARLLSPARAEGDDPRVGPLLDAALDDLRALLTRSPDRPGDLFPAAGVPWRCGLAPGEALAAARMALPLGTALAVGTLRAVARTQRTGAGPEAGHVPGPFRDAGPHLPPGCTGTEATLLFPVLLAEARRWGMAEPDTEQLLPSAEKCLDWLRTALGEGPYLRDPGTSGPAGHVRAEVQAHAHRAALLGADLLDDCGRPGADALRERAEALRTAFRRDFWVDDHGGGRPAAALAPDGRPVPHLGAAAAHLLDTGLLGGRVLAPGLLDRTRTEQLARLLAAPALDSGWGLRSLGAKEPGFNPFGHRGGAVRVQETAVAVAGLAAAGCEKEAAALLRGTLDAAEGFGLRLPEMYAGEQRSRGRIPSPHPAACRPAAVSTAACLHLLTALVGIRPDTPARTLSLHPLPGAPLGALQLTGLTAAGAPLSVRVSRLGLGMIEEAADGLQLSR
ncbi:glycogen debranching N-terminal domain-containing protein [Streptomyces sp. NPDC060194]|uniref:glycogen debranching N-terminal domain-containing protein n=1 Tax=Streptomyces sp. NPDC060194 TaxID=3347069 RepID=UPI00365CBCEF